MDDELKRLIRLLLNKAATVNGAPTAETFDNTTDSNEAISDNVGLQSAAATSDDLSDVTTTALQAKLRLLLNRMSSDAFTATIQGGARTELDTMMAQMATYIAAAGAALSIQVNGNAARDNLEQAFEDLLVVFGADGANIFNPTINAIARTSLDTALEALAGILGTLAIAGNTGAVGAAVTLVAYIKQLVTNTYRLTETAIADTTDPVDMTTEVADNTIIADILTDDGDTSSYDRRTDSLEALADAISSIAARQTQRKQAFRTTTTTQNSSVTLFALDALGGQKSRVNVRFYLALDAAATFTPAWYITRPGDELTFTVQSIPAIATIATPAANGVYSYDFPGHLAEGMQLEFRVAQDALGAATVTLDGVLTYQEG